MENSLNVDGQVHDALLLAVYFMGVLQLAQTLIITDDCWNWLIASWAKPEGIIATNLAWFDGPILVGIISFIAQCFYAWRIWMLGRSGTLVGVIVLVSVNYTADATK
ncbi:MAG TPA: hypothetical protein VGO47_02060 [Chlamydiales bacterium]|jgi:hypothetical protein|nr:hypothetical protein [Chlamydiales bacterium]